MTAWVSKRLKLVTQVGLVRHFYYTDDVTRINFRFRLLVKWSTAHVRDASSCKIWCRYLYPVRSYWHFFRNSRWRPRPSWIFRLCEFGYSSVLTVRYLCSVPNWVKICTGYWDRHTYASDVHLMTSRELTSGFDFWSRGHVRMAVVHLPVKFGAYIMRSYWDFAEIKDGGRRHLGFVGGAMGPPTQAHSWCVLPVKISSWSDQ